MKTVSLVAAAFMLLDFCRAAPDDDVTGAFRSMVADGTFPFERFAEFSPEQIQAGVPTAIETVQKACTVYRVDIDCDSLGDCVIEVPVRSRNQTFFVMHRLAAGWDIAGSFHGKEFSFIGFGGMSPPLLKAMQSTGGGQIGSTLFKLINGRYEIVERDSDLLQEIQPEKAKQ